MKKKKKHKETNRSPTNKSINIPHNNNNEKKKKS